MSHTTTYAQKVKDVEVFCSVCEELGHKVKRANPGETITVHQFSRNKIADAVAEVHLNGWKFPLAINAKGEVLYDHWGSKHETIGPNGEICTTMDLLGLTMQNYNQRVILQNIDHTKVGNVFTTQKDGNLEIVLEYA